MADAVDGEDPEFLKGIDLYNHGDYFEAHETWEGVWKDRWDDDKRFVQGLIQVAAAFEKYKWAETDTQHLRGCLSLIDMGMDKLQHYPDLYWGIRLGDLRRGVVAARAQVVEMSRSGWRFLSVPKLRRVTGSGGPGVAGQR